MANEASPIINIFQAPAAAPPPPSNFDLGKLAADFGKSRNTDWTVDIGIKIVLSGGLLAPPELQAAKPNP